MEDSTSTCCTITGIQYTTNYYLPDGDVTFMGNIYKSLIHSTGYCLVREVGNKVYVVGTSDSIEMLLYDFDLGLNDTMRFVYPLDTYTSWVTRTDSTQINGTWYKTWAFDGIDVNKDSTRSIKYNVIEGLGCTNGAYYPACPYPLTAFSDVMLCFNNSDYITGLSNPVIGYAQAHTQSFDNTTSCKAVATLNTSSVVAGKENVVVAPNPVVSDSKIILPAGVKSARVSIYNMLGQCVYTVQVCGTSIQIGAAIQSPGVYTFLVTDNTNGRIYSGKFTK